MGFVSCNAIPFLWGHLPHPPGSQLMFHSTWEKTLMPACSLKKISQELLCMHLEKRVVTFSAYEGSRGTASLIMSTENSEGERNKNELLVNVYSHASGASYSSWITITINYKRCELQVQFATFFRKMGTTWVPSDPLLVWKRCICWVVPCQHSLQFIDTSLLC